MAFDDKDNIINSSFTAVQEIRYKGFSVIEDILSSEVIMQATQKLDTLRQIQTEEIGRENIYDINEENLVRLPLAYDDYFLWHFLNNASLKNVLSELLGTYHQLHSQNGILIYPQSNQKFSVWRRDHQLYDSTASKVSAITAMYCLQDVSFHSGGPIVLPFSHKMEKLPTSEYIRQNQVAISAKAGSLILMDSLLYHHAGANNTNEATRSVKHIFTNPLMKQKIDIPSALQGKFATDPYFSMVLGYNYSVPGSVKEYREKKIRKLRK